MKNFGLFTRIICQRRPMIRCGTAFEIFSGWIFTTLQPIPRAELIAEFKKKIEKFDERKKLFLPSSKFSLCRKISCFDKFKLIARSSIVFGTAILINLLKRIF